MKKFVMKRVPLRVLVPRRKWIIESTSKREVGVATFSALTFSVNVHACGWNLSSGTLRIIRLETGK